MPSLTQPNALPLTTEQYRDLVVILLLGLYVRESVLEQRDEPIDHVRDLEEYILSQASAFGAEDMTEYFQGMLLPSHQIGHEHDAMIDEFNDDVFWNELMTRLGQRDFERAMTKDDRRYIQKHHGLLPEKIHEYYERYDHEFDEHGIDRLEIQENFPTEDGNKG